MALDSRYKPWAIHTAKVVGVGAAATAGTLLSQEIASAFFAASPIAQLVIYGITLGIGLLAKSPYFKGGKQ